MGRTDVCILDRRSSTVECKCESDIVIHVPRTRKSEIKCRNHLLQCWLVENWPIRLWGNRIASQCNWVFQWRLVENYSSQHWHKGITHLKICEIWRRVILVQIRDWGRGARKLQLEAGWRGDPGSRTKWNTQQISLFQLILAVRGLSLSAIATSMRFGWQRSSSMALMMAPSTSLRTHGFNPKQ